MGVGDAHTPGPEGHALCGASGPLRGYNATSQSCRDCASMSAPSASTWTVAVTTPPSPISTRQHSPQALLRKRPTRLYP